MYSQVEEGNIYSLIPSDALHLTKEKRYTSKFRTSVKNEEQKTKRDHRTMGLHKVQLTATDEFLKKHEKEPILPNKLAFKYPDDNKKKPSVPDKFDHPIMGLKTTKNFITNNAVENITSVPKKPLQKYADTRGGDTHLLEPSGLEMKYIHKKDFGETPVYLQKRKFEIERAQEEYNHYVAERCRRGAMKSLTLEDRKAVIEGLKANWQDIHDRYQGLSVVTDTAPKKNRKERMEAEMKQLERDIEIFEKHKIIYIAD